MPDERGGSWSGGVESDNEVQNSNDESSESDEESDQEDDESGHEENGLEEEAEGYDYLLNEEESNNDRVDDNERPRKRVKTKNGVPDEEVPSDDPVNCIQPTIKREPSSDDQASDQIDPDEVDPDETSKFPPEE